jgi:hypothetical protein
MSRSGTVLAFGIVVAAALIALLPEVASAAKKTAAAEPAFAPVVEESSLGGALTLMQMKDDAQSHENAILSAGPEGLLLVDHAGNWQTMTCDSAAAIVFEKAIRAHGDGRLRYLINTHWHGDPSAGTSGSGRKRSSSRSATRARCSWRGRRPGGFRTACARWNPWAGPRSCSTTRCRCS